MARSLRQGLAEVHDLTGLCVIHQVDVANRRWRREKARFWGQSPKSWAVWVRRSTPPQRPCAFFAPLVRGAGVPHGGGRFQS